MIQIFNIPASAVEYLRKQIILGELAPGQKLNEERLAAELNISRPPLREAFRLLESERLVLNIPRKGTFVSEMSVEDLDDLYQVREMIECRAMDLLKMRNIREIPDIEKFCESTGDFGARDCRDPDAIMRLAEVSCNFHIKLVEAARNSRLAYFYRAISSNVMRYKLLFLFLDSKHDSGEDHRRLVELIRNGFYDEIHDFLISHIQISYRFLREEIVRRGCSAKTLQKSHS
ncbi:MAG: GntR family transcriptional regulator [Pseudomonadota bacterium]